MVKKWVTKITGLINNSYLLTGLLNIFLDLRDFPGYDQKCQISGLIDYVFKPSG